MRKDQKITVREKSKEYKVKIMVEGTTALLFSRWNQEEIERRGGCHWPNRKEHGMER